MPRRRRRGIQHASLVLAALGAVCTHSSPALADDEWLSVDKAKHFTASALIAGAGYGISAPFFQHTRVPPFLIGAGAGVLAGVGKELYDATGRGDPSAKDLVWDGLGVTAGLAVAFAVDLLIRGWSIAPKEASAPAALLAAPSGVAIRF